MSNQCLEQKDPALRVCPGPLPRIEPRTAPALVLVSIISPVAAAAAAVCLTLAATHRFAAVVRRSLFRRVLPALSAFAESEWRISADRPRAVCTEYIVYNFDYKLAAVFFIPVFSRSEVIVHQQPQQDLRSGIDVPKAEVDCSEIQDGLHDVEHSSVYLSLLGYKKTLNKPPPLPAWLAY